MSKSQIWALTFDDITAERNRQDAKWGEQNYLNGTGVDPVDRLVANAAQERCNLAFADRGRGTWRLVLAEEVAEAFAESDPVKLREELIQVAAVAAAWVEAIDRRDTFERMTS